MRARIGWWLAGIAAVTVVSLAACGSDGRGGVTTQPNDKGAGTYSSSLSERIITLKDGRTVTCVIYDGGYPGGLSCDWANAKRPQ